METEKTGREHHESSRDSTQVLVAFVVAVALVQLWMAWHWFGFLTGDDVEVLAEAFRVATGFIYQAWDIRNLLVSDFIVAPPVAIATGAGVRDMHALTVLAVLPFILLTAASTMLVFRLARRWTTDTTAAIVGAVVFSLHWIPLGFGGTVYPRTVAAFAVLAAVALLDQDQSPVAGFAAGALAGVAFADRFSEGVFLVPLIAFIAFQRRKNALRRVAELLIGFIAAAVILVGAWDWFTWGAWFGSLRNFAHLTLVEVDFASRLKHQGPLWYASNFLKWLAPTLLPLFWFAREQRRAMETATFIVLPLVALSFIDHKELRYLQGLIPWIAILAALGFAAMRRSGRSRTAVVLIVVSVLWNLYGIRAFMRKSMPAVEAAMALGADSSVRTVAMSQLWAYGDRLYFTDRMQVIDIGTPPARLSEAFPFADVICLYEADMTSEIQSTLQQHGFVAQRTFQRPPARGVVVFRRVRR